MIPGGSALIISGATRSSRSPRLQKMCHVKSREVVRLSVSLLVKTIPACTTASSIPPEFSNSYLSLAYRLSSSAQMFEVDCQSDSLAMQHVSEVFRLSFPLLHFLICHVCAVFVDVFEPLIVLLFAFQRVAPFPLQNFLCLEVSLLFSSLFAHSTALMWNCLRPSLSIVFRQHPPDLHTCHHSRVESCAVLQCARSPAFHWWSPGSHLLVAAFSLVVPSDLASGQ